MRLKDHRLIRPGVLAATVTMLALTATMVWGAGVSLARTEFARGTTRATNYEDTEGNLCVGVGGAEFRSLSGHEGFLELLAGKRKLRNMGEPNRQKQRRGWRNSDDTQHR